ncbi:MAG TPA: cytochrome C oxidase subunit IV family protein [Thermoanaerobaculia bacterium]|nr:cytochrome C oxidase subunit IV family protein [Thermoanaerobaculia bacterium]
MSTHESHISSVGTLLRVFFALLALTALTTGVAYVDLGAGSTAVALAIAIAKASLVVWFFMNVRFNSRLIPVVILGGLFFVAVLFVETFADYASRGWFGYRR